MNTYLWIKTLHVVSSVVLVGTGFGTAYYFYFANRSGQLAVQPHVSRLAHACWRQGRVLPPDYWRMARWWERLGYPAFAAMLIVFYLMVAKPMMGR